MVHQNYVLIKKCRQCHRQIKEDPTDDDDDDGADGETNFCKCLMQNEVQRTNDDLFIDSDDDDDVDDCDDDSDDDNEILMKPSALGHRMRNVAKPSTSGVNKYVMDIGMGAVESKQQNEVRRKETDKQSNETEYDAEKQDAVLVSTKSTISGPEENILGDVNPLLIVDETGLPSYTSTAATSGVEKSVL